jgi:adenylate cyclase
VLLIGAGVGHVCVGRDPFDAAWRVAIPVFLIGAGSLSAFLRGSWLDPVVPAAAALAAYALVTQFTFALERSERDRNRALLRHFVAPQVVEELLDDPERVLGLGGSRQQICVLFADVRGFTRFAEGHTPEEVIEVINAYMTALREALYDHGGILDKYTGDGLMALFRVGDHSREDVVRAVRAALAMRDAADEVSERLAERGEESLALGIGMHFGEAIVGLIGNPDHFNYTALGRTVIVSQRLQALAQGGEVVVSDAVHALTTEHFAAEAGDPVRVKGLSQPVRPFWVAGPLRA